MHDQTNSQVKNFYKLQYNGFWRTLKVRQKGSRHGSINQDRSTTVSLPTPSKLQDPKMLAKRSQSQHALSHHTITELSKPQEPLSESFTYSNIRSQQKLQDRLADLKTYTTSSIEESCNGINHICNSVRQCLYEMERKDNGFYIRTRTDHDEFSLHKINKAVDVHISTADTSADAASLCFECIPKKYKSKPVHLSTTIQGVTPHCTQLNRQKSKESLRTHQKYLFNLRHSQLCEIERKVRNALNLNKKLQAASTAEIMNTIMDSIHTQIQNLSKNTPVREFYKDEAAKKANAVQTKNGKVAEIKLKTKPLRPITKHARKRESSGNSPNKLQGTSPSSSPGKFSTTTTSMSFKPRTLKFTARAQTANQMRYGTSKVYGDNRKMYGVFPSPVERIWSKKRLNHEGEDIYQSDSCIQFDFRIVRRHRRLSKSFIAPEVDQIKACTNLNRILAVQGKRFLKSQINNIERPFTCTPLKTKSHGSISGYPPGMIEDLDILCKKYGPRLWIAKHSDINKNMNCLGSVTNCLGSVTNNLGPMKNIIPPNIWYGSRSKPGRNKTAMIDNENWSTDNDMRYQQNSIRVRVTNISPSVEEAPLYRNYIRDWMLAKHIEARSKELKTIGITRNHTYEVPSTAGSECLEIKIKTTHSTNTKKGANLGETNLQTMNRGQSNLELASQEICQSCEYLTDDEGTLIDLHKQDTKNMSLVLEEKFGMFKFEIVNIITKHLKNYSQIITKQSEEIEELKSGISDLQNKLGVVYHAFSSALLSANARTDQETTYAKEHLQKSSSKELVSSNAKELQVDILVFEICHNEDHFSTVIYQSEEKMCQILLKLCQGFENESAKNAIVKYLEPIKNEETPKREIEEEKQLIASYRIDYDNAGTSMSSNDADNVENTLQTFTSIDLDIWTLGIMMHTLVDFWHHKEMYMLQQIMQGKFDISSPEWREITVPLRDLIQKLVTVGPKPRISADETLNHPFFQKVRELQERYEEHKLKTPRYVGESDLLKQVRTDTFLLQLLRKIIEGCTRIADQHLKML